jgi:ferredoxin
MKVHVDRDLCQGHAECTVEAPAVFVLPDGAAQVELLVDEVPLDAVDAVRVAVKYCPTHALTLVED